MTFRALIDRAIQQSLDDLSLIIERKLVATFDEHDEPPARTKAAAPPSRVRVRSKSKPAKVATATTKSTPAKPARDEASIRARVLDVLDRASAPMSRSQLIAALEIRPSEEARFGTALVRLRTDKLIVLEGLRRHAAYRCATIGESTSPSPEQSA